jgi:FkbM family methyltransferase
VSNAGEIYFNSHIKKYVQVMHNGLEVLTSSHYGKFNIEIIKQLRGHHEPSEELVFYEILKMIPDKATMIELGSFWGYYSLWFNSQIKEAINYLVEPSFIDSGIENFKINNLKAKKFIKACVGSECIDSIAFTTIDDTNKNNIIDGKGSIRKTVINIPQVSLDSLINDNSIKYVDIVHCDIQGCEIDMLKGAKNALSKMKVGFFFISTHSPLIHIEIKDTLKKYNYIILSDFSPRESFTSDGCVIACKPNLLKKKINVTKKSNFFINTKKLLDYFFYYLLKIKKNFRQLYELD